jgi:hypothetical protein
MNIEAEVNANTKQDDHTALFFTMENGIIASSPTWYSHVAKRISAATEPHSNPITVALLHAYSTPPHSRARSNMIANGAKRVKPIRSSFKRIVLRVGFVAVLERWWGTLIQKRKIAPRPPMGRFM